MAVVELVVRTMTTRENCRSLFFVVISFLMASVRRFVEFCVFKKHVRTHVRYIYIYKYIPNTFIAFNEISFPRSWAT